MPSVQPTATLIFLLLVCLFAFSSYFKKKKQLNKIKKEKDSLSNSFQQLSAEKNKISAKLFTTDRVSASLLRKKEALEKENKLLKNKVQIFKNESNKFQKNSSTLLEKIEEKDQENKRQAKDLEDLFSELREKETYISDFSNIRELQDRAIKEKSELVLMMQKQIAILNQQISSLTEANSQQKDLIIQECNQFLDSQEQLTVSFLAKVQDI